MTKIKFDKAVLNKVIISFLLVIALVFQFAFLSYLFKSLAPNKDEDNSNVIMSYTSSGSYDYKVYLKPNEFINSEYLGPDEAYILNLVDHVHVDSLYNFSSTEKTNVAGTSKTKVQLVVYYHESSDDSNNPEILKKENVLDEKVISFDDKTYSEMGSYDIYLDEYLKTLQEFQSQVKISVDGYLIVTSETNFNGSVGGATYKDSYSNSLKIPLSESIVKIENAKSKPKENKVYESDLVKTNKTVMGYIVVANIIVFIIICVLLKKLFMFTNKSEYERVLGKILKSYDDVIVNTSSVVDVSEYKLIEIDEFKEILNLSRELLLPIMNYEVMKGKETWLYIIKDNILYRYVVSENNLNNEKKEKKIKHKKTDN